MAGPEVLFCNILKAEYTALVSIIESTITAPLLALNVFKSTINRTNHLIYLVIEAALDVILAQLDELFKLINIDRNETSDFCRVAFACETLVNKLFDPSNDILSFLSAPQKASAQTDFEMFELYICKGGIQQMIQNWITEQVDAIEAQLNIYTAQLLESTGVDALILAYMNALSTPIYGGQSMLDLLDLLDAFGNCGFGICNYVATSSNKLEDYGERLSITQEGASWTFVDVDDKIQDFYDMEIEIQQKIALAQAKIDRWRSDAVGTLGIPKDETMGG